MRGKPAIKAIALKRKNKLFRVAPPSIIIPKTFFLKTHSLFDIPTDWMSQSTKTSSKPLTDPLKLTATAVNYLIKILSTFLILSVSFIHSRRYAACRPLSRRSRKSISEFFELEPIFLSRLTSLNPLQNSKVFHPITYIHIGNELS